jgi:hypothetical protein
MILTPITDAPEAGHTPLNSMSSMLVPDIMLPDQLCDLRRNIQLSPEGLLVLAILEDAIRCVLGAKTAWTREDCHLSTSRRRERLRLEAEKWIFNEDADAALTFDSVCAALGIHADWLREGIRTQVRKGARIPRRSPAAGAI